MARWVKILCAAVCSFAVLFSCVGYAAVSGNLSISGSASVDLTPELTEGVHITNAELTSGNGSVTSYSNTTLISVADPSTGSVTFGVTITNNTLYTQYFHGIEYDENLYPDLEMTYELEGLTVGDTLDPRTESVLDSVTFNFTVTGLNGQMPVVDFVFDVTAPTPEGGGEGGDDDGDDGGEVAVQGAAGKFSEILNNPTDYGSLITGMETVPDGRYNDSYIGNVIGSSGADSKLINGLFTEPADNGAEINYLTLQFGDEKIPVTAMIKREDLDGNSATGDEDGREMTLYLTPENPSTEEPGNGQANFGDTRVDVYAIIFTKGVGTNGKWVQLGEMYTGLATPNNYSGSGTANSFNTDTWMLSESVYDLTASTLTIRENSLFGYTYTTASYSDGATIEQVISAYKETDEGQAQYASITTSP